MPATSADEMTKQRWTGVSSADIWFRQQPDSLKQCQTDGASSDTWRQHKPCSASKWDHGEMRVAPHFARSIKVHIYTPIWSQRGTDQSSKWVTRDMFIVHASQMSQEDEIEVKVEFRWCFLPCHAMLHPNHPNTPPRLPSSLGHSTAFVELLNQ